MKNPPPRQLPALRRCAVYARKSIEERWGTANDEQEPLHAAPAQSNSISAQKETCRHFIKAHTEWSSDGVQDYSDDGISGFNMDRPGLRQLMTDAQARKFDVLIIYRFDRLSRSVRNFLEMIDFFEQCHVQLVSVSESFDTSSTMGKFTLKMIMSFSEFERDVIKERTQLGIRHKIRKGQHVAGVVPLGYQRGPNGLVVDQEGARVVVEIFHKYIETQSLAQTARWANSCGYRSKVQLSRRKRSRGGRTFTKTAVHYILKNKLYIGQVKHGNLVAVGTHPAIISQVLFDRANETLSLNRSGKIARTHRSVRRPRFLLEHMVVCATCGSAMTAYFNGRGFGYYKCSRIMKLDSSACPTKAINSKSLDRLVVERLALLAKQEKMVARIVGEAKVLVKTGLPSLTQERGRTQARLRGVEGKIQNLMSAIASGGAAAERCRSLVDEIGRLEEMKSALVATNETLEKKISDLKSQDIDVKILRENLKRFSSVFGEIDYELQKKIMALFVKSVQYDGEKKKVRLEVIYLPDLEVELDRRGQVSNNVQIGCGTRTRT